MTTVLTFTLIVLVGAYFAGLLGSLLGLGGGVVVIPVLTMLLGVDFRYAVGASLLASIATSSGSASAYVKEGMTNMRLGMFLEIATTIGAVVGATVAMYLNNNIIAVIFGVVLLFSSMMTLRRKTDHENVESSKLAMRLKLGSTYPSPTGLKRYELTNVVSGFLIMVSAGITSGLLGIGAGVLKVLALDGAMKVPFKVSTTTSNFMIGVTAAASAVVYLQRGYMDPGIALPVLVGVLFGAMTGARLLKRFKVRTLRLIFAVVMVLVAINMFYDAYIGKF